MKRHVTRRHFLGTAAAGLAVGGEEWAGLASLSADDAALPSEFVRFSAETEPVIKLIADTPPDKCIPTVMEQIRNGLPYRHLLAGLYLTAARVGSWHNNTFDHNAYSVHSAHQLALSLPHEKMWLPLFWALNSLKGGNPKPQSLPIKMNGVLPAPDKAEAEFWAGVEMGDEEQAICAILTLSRTQGAAQVGETLWQYIGRDWLFIGHLAILTSQSWRLLQTVGHQHAEPILRYVVSGLAGGKPADKQLQYWAENSTLADKHWQSLPANWAAGDGGPAFTRELVALLRERKANDACELIVSRLVSGKAKAGAVWDAVFLAAGEMIACAQKNSDPLHANTVANALRYAFGESGETRTRLLILLQAVAWTTRFRDALVTKNWLGDAQDITALTADPADKPADLTPQTILANLSHGNRDHGKGNQSPVPGWHGQAYNNQPWRHDAARQAFALAQHPTGADRLFREAASLLPAKADGDPHRIKFAVAMFENYGWVSPAWQPHLAAVASYSFLGADAPDTPTIRQVREAAGKS